MNDRYVDLDLLDGTRMKFPPEAWDVLFEAFNHRVLAVVLTDDSIEYIIPLNAIKRVFRARVDG